MRLLPPILAPFRLVRRAVERRVDARHIRRLAREVGCTDEEAKRLYRLSRQIGFGAAHEAIFGRRQQHGSRHPGGGLGRAGGRELATGMTELTQADAITPASSEDEGPAATHV